MKQETRVISSNYFVIVCHIKVCFINCIYFEAEFVIMNSFTTFVYVVHAE